MIWARELFCGSTQPRSKSHFESVCLRVRLGCHQRHFSRHESMEKKNQKEVRILMFDNLKTRSRVLIRPRLEPFQPIPPFPLLIRGQAAKKTL